MSSDAISRARWTSLRKARRIESVPDMVLEDVLAKLAAIFE